MLVPILIPFRIFPLFSYIWIMDQRSFIFTFLQNSIDFIFNFLLVLFNVIIFLVIDHEDINLSLELVEIFLDLFLELFVWFNPKLLIFVVVFVAKTKIFGDELDLTSLMHYVYIIIKNCLWIYSYQSMNHSFFLNLWLCFFNLVLYPFSCNLFQNFYDFFNYYEFFIVLY